MNKNKIALTAMLLLIGFTMTTATEVTLKKTEPSTTQESGPKRTPAKPLPIEVSLDEENRLLTFSDSSGNVYTYYIYDEAGNIVTQGILDFSADDTLLVNLSYVEAGTYTLNVVHNGQNYVGAFSI